MALPLILNYAFGTVVRWRAPVMFETKMLQAAATMTAFATLHNYAPGVFLAERTTLPLFI